MENTHKNWLCFGEWVFGNYGTAHCSECGFDVPENNITPFCPNCGACMEEIIEEESKEQQP